MNQSSQMLVVSLVALDTPERESVCVCVCVCGCVEC